MLINENWSEIKRLFRRSFRSSFHYAIASINDKGEPHITPIGSLILDKPGHGVYFEKFPKQLTRNLQNNKQVCVLAVNSSRWFWVKSLFSGRFSSLPAVRLYGTVGDIREGTKEEIKLWQRRVRRVSFSKGHAIMWANMKMVRDIKFTRVEPVQIDKMTSDK